MATIENPLASSNSGSVKKTISDAATHLKDTAGEYGRSAAEQIDKNVQGAAGALQGTAEKLRSAAPDSGKLSGIAETAASKLDSTAHMLENFDTRELMTAAEGWTRRNPGMAIGGALAVGFFIGMSLRRDRHD
ncbi:MAG: hypothetical protein SGI92_23420 [Bryobacteraceae bacterium]|nr:hypothetical protein [Bryobacteraceae bacterium]